MHQAWQDPTAARALRSVLRACGDHPQFIEKLHMEPRRRCAVISNARTAAQEMNHVRHEGSSAGPQPS